jgi:integrase
MPERVKLTQNVVQRAHVPPGAPELMLWDSELPGLALRVYASGARVYVLSYGTGTRGGNRRVRIGEHGKPWTPETARQEAKHLLGLVAQGRNPAAERSLARQTPTVADFSLTYVREHAIPHKRLSSVAQDVGNLARLLFRDDDEGERQAGRFRAGLWKEVREHHGDGATDTMQPAADPKAKAVLFGPGLTEFARKRVDRVAFVDVAAIHRGMRATPTAANRCLALISHVLAYAERRQLRPQGSNPCAMVTRFPEHKRERFLSEQELARLGAALGDAEKADVNGPYAIAAIRLLLFTGARRAEILTATWDRVDLDAGTLLLPRTKEGQPKTLPLNAPARRVLASLPRMEGNPYVICGRTTGQHLTDLERPWRRIRSAAVLQNVRLHDLRHGFASVAVAGGSTLPVIGALLGHRQAATTQRYAHLSDDPLRAASEAVGRALDAAMNPPAKPAVADMGAARARKRSGAR